MGLAQSHPNWALGFADEVWWSRLAQPNVHVWSEEDVTPRLVELELPKDDTDPKALACYGVLVRASTPDTADRMLLRFVDGRPVSEVTTDFLRWGGERLAALGKTAWLLVWDNAPWHVSKAVRRWIKQHNRAVKEAGEGVRIVACYLPSQSPWLNAIEPKWVHGKRAVVESARPLTAQELADRVCAYYGCTHEPHLKVSEKLA